MTVTRPEISENPLIQSAALSQYIAARLRSSSIDLHSALQLQHETTRIHRFGYRQAAWNHHLSISELYQVFMHCLTARALGCVDQMRAAEDWFEQDIPPCERNGGIISSPV